ncbi:MAG: helix-turn-helix domain-containing protein, partial [Actinomycetota bacterium]
RASKVRGPLASSVGHVEADVAEAEPALLTVREAAKILRIGVDLAYALVRAGVLPVLRLGERRVVIPHEPLLRWIESQARDPGRMLSGPSVLSSVEVPEEP